MKNTIRNISYILAFAGILTACSTTKNTWLSRNYQALTTRYNVYFNGNESYKEGLENIKKANVDDYTHIIPLYTISLHSNASSAKSQMDRAIEKAQKGLKLHSIKKKPKKDQKRIKDPKYQAFLKQEEYNSMMDETWMLLGKAQFHKTEFLAAVGTFTYVINHFSWNKECVSEARIWLARSYTEMEWFYDAEDMLAKANKEQVSSNLSGMFAAASADLLLKQHKYKEALPLLNIAAEKEKDKQQLTRFHYVLAQLNRLENNNELAIYYYTKVIKANPPFDMNFNARISRAEANSKSPEDAIKVLQRMLKKTKYSDRHDRIYYTIGKIYEEQDKTTEAIKNYKLAIEKNKQNIANKVQALVALADLYYSKSKYLEAQPYYNEASSIMLVDNADYARVSKRSRLLDQLNQQYEIVILQDSVQKLAQLPEAERKTAIENLIKKLQADEIALKKKLEEATIAQNSSMGDFDAQNASSKTAMGNQSQGNWYFYNSMLINNGKTDFQRRWGNRKLEDNWRRQNKTATGNDDQSLSSADSNANDNPEKADSTQNPQDKSLVNSNVNFYLQQLPTTEAQLNKSNEQIADALYKMGLIYKDELEDYPMATKTFEELERRFPKEKRLADVYFYLYQMSMKAKDTLRANSYVQQIIQKFPESTYAKVFSMPDYAKKIAEMNLVQDSIYQATYFAYTKSDYQTVFKNYELIKDKYPLSTLMPKFIFLDALSKGKSGEFEPFKNGLKQIITEYPKSDVSTIAKDILALTGQGREVQAGSSQSSIIFSRDTTGIQTQTLDSLKFSTNLKEKHLIIIVTPKEIAMNKLQYNVATYNFTGFLVKDFDLEIRKYNSTTTLLAISSLDGFEEAEWYLSGLQKDMQVHTSLQTKGCYAFVISESNYQLIKNGHSIDEYLDYYNNNIATDTNQKINQNTQTNNTKVETGTPPILKEEAKNTQNTTNTKREIVNQKDSTKIAVETIQAKQDTISSNNIVKTKASYLTEPMEPHSYAILILKGTFDFNVLKSALDTYNTSNYPIANLKVTLSNVGEQQIVLIGMLPESNTAKSYLFGIIRQRALFDALKGTEFRNVIISKRNLDELIKTKDFRDYLDFNRKSYMR